MSRSPQFEAAVRIVESLRARGYEAWLAGGCVRDLLLGRQPVDYDVATSATPDVVLDMFPRTFAVGAHFGVVLVASESGAGCEEGAVAERCVTEVATFRSDGVYSDGRHPDQVRYTTSARIHAVSCERIRDELTKMLTEGKARRAFELLDETGLLVQVLPEVARMKGVEQPPQFHPEGDVWIHTLILLQQLDPGCELTLA